MSCSPLERLVKHDFRLDLLSCLVDGPLAVPALSARVGRPEAAVAYHVRLLESRDVVEQMGEGDDGGDDALFAATLDKHPAWVAEAVRTHRKAEAG
jgi:Helix-turn-helix domain